MRAATATGQSIPGAMTPFTSSARARCESVTSSSAETTARRSANWKPGAPGSRSHAMTKSPRSRAGQPLRFLGGADVAVHLTRPLRRVHLERARPADAVEDEVGDLGDGDVAPGRNVHDLPGHGIRVARDERLDRLGVVLDVEPVAARVTVAVDRERLVPERPRDEARGHLLRGLGRRVIV